METSVNGRASLDPLPTLCARNSAGSSRLAPRRMAPGTVRVEDVAGPSVRVAAVVTAVDVTLGPLCGDVGKGS